MDHMTTSPVESINNSVKHGPSFVNSRMNLEKSIERLLSGITERLRRNALNAKKELGMHNYASQAPTREYVTRKGQALIDRNHDRGLKMKSAQMGPTNWICWNFDTVDKIKVEHEVELFLPKYYRVHNLRLEDDDTGKS